MRINLTVPYEQKDEAKRLGARWDAARKIWFLENVEDLTPFMRWIPSESKKPSTNKIDPEFGPWSTFIDSSDRVAYSRQTAGWSL